MPQDNDMNVSQHTVAKLRNGQNENGRGQNKSRRANLRPFTTGDVRINRHGRPKNFDAFRRLAQAIAHEPDPENPSMTTVEAILRSWAMSKEPTLQKAFVEYAFGKVPDKLETTGLESKPVLVLHYAHERPQRDQHRRFSSGLS